MYTTACDRLLLFAVSTHCPESTGALDLSALCALLLSAGELLWLLAARCSAG
jgi:hypothetical protein